jgi:hypothetical protein
MAKFRELNYNYRLKNAQHFAFIQAFITALQAENFTAARIVAKLTALSGAFSEEDRYYMLIRASEIIAQRTAADEKRDRYYTRCADWSWHGPAATWNCSTQPPRHC